jgi:hypothetical protein
MTVFGAADGLWDDWSISQIRIVHTKYVSPGPCCAMSETGGRVFFVDSRREPASTACDHIRPEVSSSPIARRKLNDGREFRIYKVFYDLEEFAKHSRRTFDVEGPLSA